MMLPGCDIILASASTSRRKLLEAAGIPFRCIPAGVDEAAIKRDHRSDTGFEELARKLAIRKALHVSNGNPRSLVIGGDQVLAFEGEAFDKPDSVGEARRQLLRLRGKTHSLKTAIACARGNDLLWSHVESPQLTMRGFSTEFLDGYLASEGCSVTETVGGYKLEGLGIQLFDRISGDYFSILGLPLLPLLAFLRTIGAVTT